MHPPNYKGNPILGVVLIPSKNELWISNEEFGVRKKMDIRKKQKYQRKKVLAK